RSRRAWARALRGSPVGAHRWSAVRGAAARFCSRPLHVSQGTQPPLQVVLGIGGDEAGGFGAVPILRLVGAVPVTGEERSEEFDRLRGGGGRSRWAAGHAHHAPHTGVERPVRTGIAAAGAFGEARGPAADGEGAKEVGIENEGGWVHRLCQRVQRSDEEEILL